MESKFIE
jgi:hypothetical protein